MSEQAKHLEAIWIERERKQRRQIDPADPTATIGTAASEATKACRLEMKKQTKGKSMRNSFSAGIKITTPVPVPDVFPTVGHCITGIPMTTEHWMPPCRWHDDATVTVEGRTVTVNGKFRAEIPEGSTVETVSVL